MKWDSDGKIAGYYYPWLDAGAYTLRDSINEWLTERGIKYEHQQNIKWFVWEFEDEKFVSLFLLEWAS